MTDYTLDTSTATGARARLLEVVSPGDTVYTVLRHVSRSGMSRSISPVIVRDSGPWDISGLVATATGRRFDRDRGGVIVGGCGMDMGFALVYDLSHALWPDGFHCIGKGTKSKPWCPSNDHLNDRGPRWSDDDETRLRMLIGAEPVEKFAAELRELRARRTAARKLWSSKRLHSDGGYALRQVWL